LSATRASDWSSSPPFPVVGKPSEKKDTNLKHLSELIVIEESVWGFKYEGRRKVFVDGSTKYQIYPRTKYFRIE
jgi:hypothetical protein